MGGTITSTGNSTDLENIPEILKQIPATEESIKNLRLQRILGLSRKDGMATLETIPSEAKDRSNYACTKWQFMLDSPFLIGSNCCNIMKKSPSHKYTKETGRKPITAQMASESRLRTQQWLKNGCNGFNMKSPISNPMAFWTEEDVLAYIAIFKIPICSVYGDIVIDDGTPEGKQIYSTEGWLESGIFDNNRPPLKTTGCSRTGCVFCGYGCHLEKDGEGRFERLKETHPQLYNYVFNDGITKYTILNKYGSEIQLKHVNSDIIARWVSQNRNNSLFTIKEQYLPDKGLGYKYIIDWMNEHGNLHIKY